MAPLTLKLFLALVLSLVCNCLVNAKNSRFTGGSKTNIATNTYVVAVSSRGLICGGALVSPTHVVTAAHCVINISVEKLIIRAGSSFAYKDGQTRGVERVSIPTDFNAETLYNDVAVIKLISELSGPNINAIALCNHPLKEGDMSKVSGWGFWKNPKFRNQLRAGQVEQIDIQTCSNQYPSYAYRLSDTNSAMCIKGPARAGTCTGNGGIPLVSEGQLCGIASWGLGCGNARPGVFTDINKVKNFIETQLQT